jgi:subtilisin family serine protease
MAAAPAQDANGKGNGNSLPGELIVKFKSNATDADIQRGLKVGHLKVKRHLQTEAMHARGHNGITLTETDLPVDQAIAQLKNDPSVDYVEPNYTYKHQYVSNDPYVTGNYTWGLYSALSSPANTYGSGAEDAWAAGYTGTNGVYVAVIDEGIDYSHPELSGNMFNNPFDPPDGIDNDGNGYVDDVHGWNFYDGNNQIFDSTGDDHGTHVSGTIGAKGGNGSGVAGVNWNVTILSGKFLGANGGDTLAAVEAIDYFVDMKKRHNLNLVAINASWGGSGYSQSLHDAIIRAAKAGILFCVAAGNDTLNNDVSSSYPANIDTRKGTTTETAASYDSVIAVAAIDSTGALASFSNYGSKTVHIGAPGVQILSTFPNSQLGYMSGTSMATPHVTGAVALYASSHPGASAPAIRDAILGAVTPTASLSGKTTTGGRLNISSVITPVAAAPNAPTGLTAVGGSGLVNLSWTAVTGATGYTVKRSTTSGGPYTTLANNASTTFTDAAVANGTKYYYVVAAVTANGTSANSAEASATPQAPVTVSAPTGVNASAAQAIVAGTANVTVRWAAVSGATSYQVKRAASASGTYTTVATGVTGTSFSQAVAATANNTYYYRVVAVTSGANSADSATATVSTVAPAPANLAATALSSSSLQLSWADHSADEQGFKIEYWTGYSWAQIGTVGAGVTSVNITGTSSRSTYWFRIRAYNGTANTAYSNSVSVTMP